jgi:hypothetical protein
MATTTNYSWTTPDDTDLVKDGAAAIRTLGSSVDTTTKALNPSTTLGDIEYRSSTANTNTRLGIGTTGQILTVAGGVPSWATPAVAASGLTLIQRSTFTDVANTSTTFDGMFTSTYISYLIEIENLGSASGDDTQFVFRQSGASSANHYGNSMKNAYNSATWASTSSNNVGFITICQDGASPTDPLAGQIFVTNTGGKNAIMNGYVYDSSAGSYHIMYGNQVAAGTVTGFLLKSASSNITGTVSVYGLAK